MRKLFYAVLIYFSIAVTANAATSDLNRVLPGLDNKNYIMPNLNYFKNSVKTLDTFNNLNNKKILFITDNGTRLSDTNAMGFLELKNSLEFYNVHITEIAPFNILSIPLDEFDIVVFSVQWLTGPYRVISDAEAMAIINFVKSGKGLFLIGEHGLSDWSDEWNYSANKIGREFGIEFDMVLVCDGLNHYLYNGDPDEGVDLPIISNIIPHNLTDNVNQFTLNWGTVLRSESPAKVLAYTSSSSWIDTNAKWDGSYFNCINDYYDSSGSFPVLAVVESLPRGRVVAISDSGLLCNWGSYEYDNYNLAMNIFDWLSEKKDGDNTTFGLLHSSWGQRGPYVYTEKEDYNKNGTSDNYVFGCTAVAVGQLINYYLQHGCLNDQGCRDGWLEVMLQGIKVNPSFCNNEGKKCKKLKPNPPQQGYVTETNYLDLIINDESQEAKNLKDFLWNVAMGLDSIFSEKSTAGGEKNFIEEFIIPGNKLSKLLSDRYRFSDISKWSPKTIKRLDLAREAIKYYIDNKRPVLFVMDLYVEGNKKKIGHVALIDGYDESPGGDFKVKINWGWGNLGNENDLLYNTDGPIEVKYTEIKNNEQKQQNLKIINFRIYGAPVPNNY